MNDVKIILTYKTDDGNYQTESVWASKKGNYYQINNTPFFAENVAYGDLVSVEEDNGALYFDDLIESSGHSTVQVIFFDSDYIAALQKQIELFNCSWEGSHVETLISIDVPKDVAYTPIKDYLEQGEKAGFWSYKEACLAHDY